MNYYFATYISCASVLLPLATIVIRRKRVGKDYLPLALLIVAATLNEGLGFIGDFHASVGCAIGNVYVLFELLLILWLYHRIGLTFTYKLLIGFVIIAGSVWLLDNLVFHSLRANNSTFRMIASLMIVFIAIDKLHLLLLFHGKPQVRDPEMLITFSFLLYFVYKTFVEAYHLFPVPHQRSFYRILWMIMNVINTITNIILALGIVCIRPKTRHFMHS
ncbi:MAG: hypothetical protein V4539_08710 [Bacteroidota bacterium]